MFDIGEIVDGKYRVDGVCSDTGGMGAILYVTQLVDPPDYPLVLKYCRNPDDEHIKRFRREVRLLSEFSGNSKVVQIEDKNLSADPPYFVMRFYADGDLTKIATELQSSYALQEQHFLKMIDCVQELHARNEFHRDIKPQNFLREGDQLVVSDLGLSTELLSATAFTSSSALWGTHGYIPPEFLQGGFKHADAAGTFTCWERPFILRFLWPGLTSMSGDALSYSQIPVNASGDIPSHDLSISPAASNRYAASLDSNLEVHPR